MKKGTISLFILVIISIVVSQQNLGMMIQPGNFYRLSEKDTLPADSLFSYDADTSYYPTFHNGNRAICKGVWMRRGTSSGEVCVHPLYRSDTSARSLIYIDSASDGGYYIPFLYDKIFLNGTTINRDSLGFIPVDVN